MLSAIVSTIVRGVAGARTTVLAALLVVSASATTAAAQSLPDSMQFVLIHGDARSGYCHTDGSCMDWIAAEGRIDKGSPAALRKMLASIGNSKLPIVVRSGGGNVDAALAMGRLIRARGLSVAVGGTRLNGCPIAEPLCAEGWRNGAKGSVYSAGSFCYSACPFMLAGGVRRMFSQFSSVGVHQITMVYDGERIRYRTEYQVVNGKKRILARQEIGREWVGQHSNTKMTKAFRKALLAYFNEMGVDSSIFDLAMSATPQALHLISQLDGAAIKLTTDLATADELVAAGACPVGRPLSGCVAPASVAPSALKAEPAFAAWKFPLTDDFLVETGWTAAPVLPIEHK